MAVPIIEVSRKEVERWLSAGTLGDGPMYKDFDNGYYLVACAARFNGCNAKNWVPWVVDTYYGDDDAQYTASALDHESVDLDFTTCPVICYEIWHLVNDVITDESKAKRMYDFASEVMELYPEYSIPTPADKIFFDAWQVIEWYIEQYCVPDDTYDWWYPHAAIARLQLFMDLKGLDDLRAACAAEVSNNKKTPDTVYEDALTAIYVEDIPF